MKDKSNFYRETQASKIQSSSFNEIQLMKTWCKQHQLKVFRPKKKHFVNKSETGNWIGLHWIISTKDSSSEKNQTKNLSVVHIQDVGIFFRHQSWYRLVYFTYTPLVGYCAPINYFLWALPKNDLMLIGFKRMMSHIIYMNNDWIIGAWSNVNLLWAYFPYIFTNFNLNS